MTSSFKKAALIGNPNSGKTTIFNALTGSHQYVGNWPGVTVEKKSGFFNMDGSRVEVIDLPGVYSLSVISSASHDEKITRDFLLYEKPDCVINIVDASNLERNLYMTVQLLEMQLPVILVLNMMDVAASANISIDVLRLAQILNVPVIPMVASRTKGIEELKRQIVHTPLQVNRDFLIAYPPSVEASIHELEPFVAPQAEKYDWSKRWLAIHLLDGDIDERLFGAPENRSEIERIRNEFPEKYGEDADTMIADGRYGCITEMGRKLITHSDRLSQSVTEMIDRVALGKYTGIPVFMLVMYLMFVWTISVGGMLIEPIETFGDVFMVEKSAEFLTSMAAPSWLVALLSEGVGRGVSTVATFIPPIAFLFIFLSFLEDSGYMARGAFVMDKLMRSFDLPGTAFVPMIVAFGCTVPAVMGTRILSSMRDRLVTLMMTPFMSCGARLPVYALFATAFFSTSGSNIVFLLYLTGILVAVLTGILFKFTLLKGKPVPLILEMPPYHMPTVKNIAVRTWDRLHGFIVRAGVLIVPLVIVLNLLNAIDFKGNYIPEQPEQSVLSYVGQKITPAFKPLGITEQNWPATVGLFTGVMAKEAIIGSLDALYAGLSDGGTASERLVVFFDGKAGAFAYLLFILLYVPCLSAVAAIAREFGVRWAAFTVVWTTGQAFALSTLFYQSAIISRDMRSSLSWIISICLFEVLVFAALHIAGKRRPVT